MPYKPAKPCDCGCGRLVRGSYAPGHRPVVGYRSVGGRAVKRLHVLRAERALGRRLPAGAIVHHADGSKRDDAPLVICQDQKYHALLHMRMRAKLAGGNPDTDGVCSTCGRAVPFTGLSSWPRARSGRCAGCQRAYTLDRADRRPGGWNPSAIQRRGLDGTAGRRSA
jgi:hypothetical protein